MSKTPLLTFVYISKCDTFGSSKKKFKLNWSTRHLLSFASLLTLVEFLLGFGKKSLTYIADLFVARCMDVLNSEEGRKDK